MNVRHVEFGSVIARIARLDNGVEVIPMPEVYRLLGIAQHTLSEHLGNFIGQTDSIPENSREALRAAGILPSGRGRPPRMVTKEEFQFLVKKVNTPQAWAVYQALWGMVEQQVKAADEGMPAWALEIQRGLEDVKGICRDAEQRAGRAEDKLVQIENVCRDAEQRAGRTEDKLVQIENVCRGLRDEVDELRATLNLLISDDDEKAIRSLIRRIKDKHNCDGRKVVGMVRQTLNVGSIYDTPNTKMVINVLKNLLGEGLQLVKDEG